MTDLIDRQAAKEAVRMKFKDLLTRCEVNEILNALPPVDTDLSSYSDKLWKTAYERGKAERKKGKWIKEKSRGQLYQCSACGNYLDFRSVNVGRGSANFCPNCGADMREPE